MTIPNTGVTPLPYRRTHASAVTSKPCASRCRLTFQLEPKTKPHGQYLPDLMTMIKILFGWK